MRRCLFLLSTLILLTLAVELCSARAVGLGGVASPLACVVDDDADAELESETVREGAAQDAWFWGVSGQQMPVHPGKVEVSLSFNEAAPVEAGLRVRRHRWLCVECC